MGFLDYLPYKCTLEYEGGHPGITKDGEVTLNIMNNKITVNKGLFGGSFSLTVDQITSARLETQHEIQSRYTATRIALLGVFALAFKKKKDIKHKYLTIEIKENGMEYLVIFTGKQAQQAHGQIVNRIKTFGQNTDNNTDENTESTSYNMDISEKLRELKGLLDEGILTQEEFNDQKKKILN